MSTLLVPPHEARASQADLMAMARFWQWERTVRQQLPDVIAGQNIKILFQPIYEVRGGIPLSRGFEALARFPMAPRIPVGLWFRIAHGLGLGQQLEMTAARKAFDRIFRLPEGSFLCINACLMTATLLQDSIPRRVLTRLVLDVPYASLADPTCPNVVKDLREMGVRVAIDDVPMDDLFKARSTLLALAPDYLKVDVIAGLSDNPMARFNLTDGARWCQDSGITLIAERVERATDLPVLAEMGIEWAQGYSLARPTEL